MKRELDRLVVLQDLLADHESILAGWTMPSDVIEHFASEIERAARRAGGVPFGELDFETYDEITKSAVRRNALDKHGSVIDAVANALIEDLPTPGLPSI